jgi:hypothetical protein
MDMDTSPGVVQRDGELVGEAYGEDMQEDEVSTVRRCRIGLDYPQPALTLSWNEPVAVCSFVYRYHDNGGKGALKYQPVTCSKILLPAHCDELRRRRGHGAVKFHFDMRLAPGCTDFQRKVMTVPSIGCPKLLTDIKFCKKLLWAAHAQGRPTLLVVHESEVDFYMTHVKETMGLCGVGIVAWRSNPGVLGFGVSRLAAQQLGQCWGNRGEVVMSDVNVVDARTLESGYDSDKEEKARKSVRSTTLYLAAGQGAGTPRKTWDDGVMSSRKAEGGAGRPLEQVVTVGDELLYDPCFITSSEDADMTAAFLDEENRMRTRGSVSTKTFRGTPEIEKVDIGSNPDDFLTDAYAKARDDYVKKLDWENAVLVRYRQDDAEHTVTIGDLAESFAKAHGLNAEQIRSLIVEKVLLKRKWS